MTALTKAMEALRRVEIAEASMPHLLAALLSQDQLDEEGVAVGVSRQAVDKAIEIVESWREIRSALASLEEEEKGNAAAPGSALSVETKE